MPDIQIGEWLPDRHPVDSPGVAQMLNLLPRADGCSTIKGPRDRGFGALPTEVRGAFYGRTQGGVDFIVAGTASKLFLLTFSSFSDVSKAGGYTLAVTDRWEFALYGNFVFATCKTYPVQVYQIGVSSLFADLSADASKAKVLAVSNEFLILGDLIGQGANASAIGTLEGAVHWSAIGVPSSWPIVGTSAAVAVQSDYQPLQGGGGPVNAVVAAGEYVCVLRERQIWRMDYVGGAPVFQLRLMDPGHGCVIPGAAIAVGNLVYYPSRVGWYVFNGESSTPIGYEKVDRFWRAKMDFQTLSLVKVSVAHVPSLGSVIWSFPNFGSLLAYQYEIARWYLLQPAVSMEWLLQAYMPISGSLDTPPYDTQNMDTDAISTTDLDSLVGDLTDVFGAFGVDHIFYQFDGTEMPGVLEIGDFETEYRIRLRNVRPAFVGSGSVSGAFSARRRPFDPIVYGLQRALTNTGVITARSTGRYTRGLLTTSGDVYLKGLTPATTDLGGR